MKRILLSLACAAMVLVNTSKAQSWTDLGSNESTNTNITKTAAFALYLQTSQAGEPCFSFIDDDFGPNNTGDFKIHFRKYNGTQWVDLGNGASPAIPANDFFPMAFDGNTAYMAYSEPAHLSLPQKLTVKRFNSTTSQWETVGTPGFSAGTANSTAIAAANGKIFVAYADGSVNDKVTVKMFSTANTAAGWQTLGTAGFSTGAAMPNVGSGISLAIDNGEPYIAYADISFDAGTGGAILIVKKFNGLSWDDVGTNNASNNHLPISATLRFDASHVPYVAYIDALDAKGYVRKLVAGQWVSLGTQPPVQQVFANVSFHILKNHVFVAYAKPDAVAISQAAVKKYDATSNSWVDVGNAPISTGNTGVSNVALESNGINKLFLVYRNGNGGIFAKSFDATALLPVTLQSFDATKQQDKTLLQWQTTNEQNNLHFQVQHSLNGIDFSTIGTVNSKGDAVNGHTYSFVHAVPATGVNYYRLKQVDKDGSSSFSKTVSISFSKSELVQVALYPNPVKDVLHVQHNIVGIKEASIKDATGRTIKQVKVNVNNFDIPVQELPTGTYLLCISNGAKTETKVFVK